MKPHNTVAMNMSYELKWLLLPRWLALSKILKLLIVWHGLIAGPYKEDVNNQAKFKIYTVCSAEKVEEYRTYFWYVIVWSDFQNVGTPRTKIWWSWSIPVGCIPPWYKYTIKSWLWKLWRRQTATHSANTPRKAILFLSWASLCKWTFKSIWSLKVHQSTKKVGTVLIPNPLGLGSCLLKGSQTFPFDIQNH